MPTVLLGDIGEQWPMVRRPLMDMNDNGGGLGRAVHPALERIPAFATRLLGLFCSRAVSPGGYVRPIRDCSLGFCSQFFVRERERPVLVPSPDQVRPSDAGRGRGPVPETLAHLGGLARH